MPRPVLAATPPSSPAPRLARRERTPGNKAWRFSFRFLRQIPYFGLSEASSAWFVSLFERLRELENEVLSDFLADGNKKSAWRYHAINWAQPNIPIQRLNLDWLPEDYLKNEDEFPLVQFQVSQSLGRVIGFFDQDFVFNVVLLDRMHNLQPTMSYDYKVDKTEVISSDYTSLKLRIEEIREHSSCSEGCEYRLALEGIEMLATSEHVVMVSLSGHEHSFAVEAVTNGAAKSHRHLYLTGVDYFSDTTLADDV